MLEFDFQAVAGDFHLHARSGQAAQRMGLFGPSGSGKTTLLHCLAGLLKPRRGRIALNGRVLFDADAGTDVPPHKRQVGYVFQDGRLFPHMTVRANIQYGRRRDTHGPGIEELRGVLGLHGLLDRLPRSLCGGERQRVALARALAAGPKLLLLDEPLASLDAKARLRILAYLKQAYETWRVPFVYVSHSLSEVMFLTERSWDIRGGKVVGSADPADLVVGSGEAPEPLLNVLTGTVTEAPEHTGYARVRCGDQDLKVPGADLRLGGNVAVALPARDLILSLTPLSGISARNTFGAKVTRLELNGRALWATVEAGGNPLLVELTEDAGNDLHLREGMDVYLIVKAHSIRTSPLEAPAHD